MPAKKAVNSLFWRNSNSLTRYWLGFFCADGCVATNKKDLPPRIVTGLKCTDHKHIAKFKHAIESDHQISFIKKKLSKYCACTLQIRDGTLAHDLNRLGCIPGKSYYLKWHSHFDSKDLCHFVRGYFDGDGCIYYNKANHSLYVTFVGTPMFISGLHSCLQRRLLKRGSVHKHKHAINTVTLAYSGIQSPLAVLNWMYSHSSEQTRLNRKYTHYKHVKRLSEIPLSARNDYMNQLYTSDAWAALHSCNRCKHVAVK